jgi:hypothetical protein
VFHMWCVLDCAQVAVYGLNLFDRYRYRHIPGPSFRYVWPQSLLRAVGQGSDTRSSTLGVLFAQLAYRQSLRTHKTQAAQRAKAVERTLRQGMSKFVNSSSKKTSQSRSRCIVAPCCVSKQQVHKFFLGKFPIVVVTGESGDPVTWAWPLCRLISGGQVHGHA